MRKCSVVFLLTAALVFSSLPVAFGYEYDGYVDDYAGSYDFADDYIDEGQQYFLLDGEDYSADAGDVAAIEPFSGTWTITFDPNGGIFTNPSDATRQIENGNEIGALPQMHRGIGIGIVKEGFRFTGWFTDVTNESTRVRADTVVNGDMTLYARWAHIPFPDGFRIGDVTGDGRITSADATLLNRWLVDPDGHHGAMWSICLLAADINGDGEVTVEDLILLARWLVGLDIRHLLAFSCTLQSTPADSGEVYTSASILLDDELTDEPLGGATGNTLDVASTATPSGEFGEAIAALHVAMATFAEIRFLGADAVLIDEPGISTPSNFAFPAQTLNTTADGFVDSPAATDLAIINIGNADTGDLTVAISGAHASAFSVNMLTIPSIAIGERSNALAITPVFDAALMAGITAPTTFTATITVSSALVGSETTTITATVNPAGPAVASLTISSETAVIGGEVTVTLSLNNNPGFASLPLRVTVPTGIALVMYDTPESLRTGLISFTGPQNTSRGERITDGLTGNIYFNWVGTANHTADGVLLTLTLEIAPDAEIGNRPITGAFAGRYGAATPTDDFGADLDIAIINGSVQVAPARLLGSVSGGAQLSNFDAILIARHLAGHEDLHLLPGVTDFDISAGIVTPGSLALGHVRLVDAIMIMRYLANHPIVLGEYPVPQS